MANRSAGCLAPYLHRLKQIFLLPEISSFINQATGACSGRLGLTTSQVCVVRQRLAAFCGPVISKVRADTYCLLSASCAGCEIIPAVSITARGHELLAVVIWGCCAHCHIGVCWAQPPLLAFASRVTAAVKCWLPHPAASEGPPRVLWSTRLTQTLLLLKCYLGKREFIVSLGSHRSS